MTDSLQIIMREKLERPAADSVRDERGEAGSTLPTFADQVRHPTRGISSRSERMTASSSSTRLVASGSDRPARD